jgi:hypothetical protein
VRFAQKELRKFGPDAKKLILKVQEAGWHGDRIARHGAVLLSPDRTARICIPRSVNGRMLDNTMAPFKRWMIQQNGFDTTTIRTEAEVEMPACAECGKVFERKQQVTVHHAMVHDLKQCPHCARKMNASNLARHIASAHTPYLPVETETAPVDMEAPLTLAGIELPPAAFASFPADLPHGADYFKPSVDQSPVDQLDSIRAILMPHMEREMKRNRARILELERMIVDQSVVHKKELEECSAKLELIRGLL